MGKPASSSRDFGMAGVPMVLIISVFLAAVAIGLGTKSLERFSFMRSKQKSIQSFDKFVEAATVIGYGEIGRSKQVYLELDGGRIIVEGSLARLERDNETFRSKYLPLPIRNYGRDKFSIRTGNFSIELAESDRSLNEDNKREIFLSVIRL